MKGFLFWPGVVASILLVGVVTFIAHGRATNWVNDPRHLPCAWWADKARGVTPARCFSDFRPEAP